MEIPGYQWDPVKKRYFKILKTGELPNSSYTISALADQARQTERRRVATFRSAEPPGSHAIGSSVSKLGRRAQAVMPARSATALTSFALIPTNSNSRTRSSGLPRASSSELSHYSPVVAHRDGLVASADTLTPSGRSIVALYYSRDHGLMAAAVDNEFGSVVASTNGRSVKLPGAFVSALAATPDHIAIASTSGLTVCSAVGSESLNLGSLSSVTADSGTVYCGSKNGTIKTADLATTQSTTVFWFPNKRAITNVALLKGNLLACTGLEDQMYLLDTRLSPKQAAVRRFEYENWSTARHGLSIDPHSGDQIAVAQENGIRIFDLQGSILTTLPMEPTPLPYVQWTDEGLYFCSKNRLKVFAKRRIVPDNNSEDLDALYQELNRA